LGDFVTLPGTGGPGLEAFALRLLNNTGGVFDGLLVADSEDVKRLDIDGSIVTTYDVFGEDSWFALNLDPDGESFWSGDFNTGNFYKFNIETGAVLASQNTGAAPRDFLGLAVFGEITAAVPPPGNGVVPEPSTILLFGSGLLGLGLWRWRDGRQGQ